MTDRAASRRAPDRTAMIRAVHVAARARGLEGEAYRAMLRRHGGAESCRDMTITQLARVLDHLNGHKPSRRPRPVAQGRPGLGKARALWLDLWCLGEVSDASEAALEAYAARMTKGAPGQAGQGVQRLEWLDDAHLDRLIKGLRGWLGRVAPALGRPDAPLPVPSEVGPVMTARPKVRVAVEQARRLGLLGMAVDAPGGAMLCQPDDALDRLLAERGRMLREAMVADGIEAPLSRWLRERR